jgi:hypothetical protein
MNRACAVETTDENHIPVQWRSGTLGAVKTAHTGEVCPLWTRFPLRRD